MTSPMMSATILATSLFLCAAMLSGCAADPTVRTTTTQQTTTTTPATPASTTTVTKTLQTTP
jgi:hypothetical protein